MKRLHFTTLGATVLAVALGVSVDANAQSAASNLANGVGTTNALRSGPAYRTVGPVFVAPSVGVADEPARVESYERSLTETSVAEDVAPVDMDAQKQRALEILEESQRRAKEAKNRRPARKIDVPDTLGVLNRPIQSAPKQTVPNPRFQQYAPSATVPAVADEQTDVPALQSVPRPAAQTFGVSRPPVATSNRKVDAIVDDLDASVPGVAPFPEALEEAPAQPLTTTFMPQIPTVPQTTRPDADALETGTDDGVPTVESDEYDSDFSQSVLEELRPELSNAELDAEPLEETDAPVDTGESAPRATFVEPNFVPKSNALLDDDSELLDESSPILDAETLDDPVPARDPEPLVDLTPAIEPEPAPEAAPSLAPALEPEPAPEAAPTSAPALEPEPAPEAAPSLAPALEPEPAPEAAPSLAPALEAEPAPEAAPSLAPALDSEPAPEAASSPAAVPESKPAQKAKNVNPAPTYGPVYQFATPFALRQRSRSAYVSVAPSVLAGANATPQPYAAPELSRPVYPALPRTSGVPSRFVPRPTQVYADSGYGVPESSLWGLNAAPIAPKNAGLIGGAEWLYWTTDSDKAFVSDAGVLGADSGTDLQSEGSGLRGRVGFRSLTGWDFIGTFTWFNEGDEAFATPDLFAEGMKGVDGLDVAAVEGKLKTDLQAIDLEIGRWMKLGTLDARVFGGFRWTQLNEEYSYGANRFHAGTDSDLLGELAVMDGVDSDADDEALLWSEGTAASESIWSGSFSRSRLNAYGVRIGLETRIELGYGLGVYGKGAGALAAGRVKSTTYDGEGMVVLDETTKTYLTPSVDASLGLSWKTNGFEARAGYEFNGWYNSGLVAGKKTDFLAHGVVAGVGYNY